MDIYETENSKYEIDLPNLRYRRTPLAHAVPNVPSPRLLYGEWLPLKDMPDPVNLIPAPGNGYQAPESLPPCLHIMGETSTHGILTSPITFMALGVEG